MVFFYAHRNYPGPVCAGAFIENIPPTYSKLIKTMREKHIRYLLYEEKLWARSKSVFNLKAVAYEKDFKILGKWYHKDTGDLILLERIGR